MWLIFNNHTDTKSINLLIALIHAQVTSLIFGEVKSIRGSAIYFINFTLAWQTFSILRTYIHVHVYTTCMYMSTHPRPITLIPESTSSVQWSIPNSHKTPNQEITDMLNMQGITNSTVSCTVLNLLSCLSGTHGLLPHGTVSVPIAHCARK